MLVDGQATCSLQELSGGQKMPLVQAETPRSLPGCLGNPGLTIFRKKLANSALVHNENEKI